MIFWAVLLIREFLDMLKVYAEPERCRSTVAQEELVVQTEANGTITQSIAYPNHKDRGLIKRGVAKNNVDRTLNDTVAKNNEAYKRQKIPVKSKDVKEETKSNKLYDTFHERWDKERVLGVGGDGVVYLYRLRKQQSKCIAVKVPRQNSIPARRDLAKEIKNLCLFDPHDHVLGLNYSVNDWWPCGPAMFLPICDLGDLISYRESWCAQQAWERKPERVSEITMWKLFRDMVLALNYIHHELGIRYVHNDFKPANVLAVTPPDHTDKTLPEQPIFKLADFARLTPWPTPKGQRSQGFDGTPEYAPPEREQIAPIHPSADIWGLGATLQFMALGIHPTQSRKAFILNRKAQGKTHPELEDNREWTTEYWRIRIPTIFRPIDVTKAVLYKEHDLEVSIKDYQPYSESLGYWYAQLWKPLAKRPKASKLVWLVIPQMDDQIESIKKMRQAEKVSE
ncbi:hypothetical protein EKO04_003569 [Ascochyta lentis]|uniref:Protein kinase domain-containing protein n=1 Tax=Ascochyta lentis TaxID=205686 RepID=A0A8H7J9Q1_9PLEO|nr:hypothetical protein EKO04_003569 [Ascochyta lentis]